MVKGNSPHHFLSCGKRVLYAGKQEVILRGVNLGGWLMMEGYILHARNLAEQIFKKGFAKKLGPKALKEFESSFQANFIKEADFQTIKSLGFNCIRLPFNYRLIEKSPYRYSREGLGYLDQAVRWAKKHGLWVILDLHAACGSQNEDWHSDSLGQAGLWQKKYYQDRTCALWEMLADRYKHEKIIAGYDLLNEPVTDRIDVLNRFYAKLIQRIRRVDKDHILFIEGNRWAIDLDCLDCFADDKVVLSIHMYEPLEFTFNFIPLLSYPSKGPGGFSKRDIEQLVAVRIKPAQDRNRPVFVGEFGVNARGGIYGESRWLEDVLDCYKKHKIHWTYWTYKAIKNALFPDGIYSYRPNPPWVSRQGVKQGWETYAELWPKGKKEIMRSWQTQYFQSNKEIVNVLKKFLRN